MNARNPMLCLIRAKMKPRTGGSKQSAVENVALYRSGESARHWRSFQQFDCLCREPEAIYQVATMLENPLHLFGCPADRGLMGNRII